MTNSKSSSVGSQIYVPRIPGVSNDFVYTPDQFGFSFEDIWMTASDGIKLHAWFMWPKDWPQEALATKPTVLFLQVLPNKSTSCVFCSWCLSCLSRLRGLNLNAISLPFPTQLSGLGALDCRRMRATCHGDCRSCACCRASWTAACWHSGAVHNTWWCFCWRSHAASTCLICLQPPLTARTSVQ